MTTFWLSVSLIDPLLAAEGGINFAAFGLKNSNNAIITSTISMRNNTRITITIAATSPPERPIEGERRGKERERKNTLN